MPTAFHGLLPSSEAVSAFIAIENGVDGGSDPVPDVFTREFYVSRVYAGLRFKAEGLASEVRLTAPLFHGGDFITLGADFGEGLSPANMVNFLLALFGGVAGERLMLPESGFLDAFGLKTLSVTLRRGESGFPELYAISPLIGTKRPLQMPIPNLTLASLDLRFLLQWGYSGVKRQSGQPLTVADASASLLQGDVKCHASLALPNKKSIELFLSASLPDFEFDGVIRLEKDGLNGADMIMGDGVAGSLPPITLAEIRVRAGYASRALSLEAIVYDAVSFRIAGLTVALSEVNAGAWFTPGGSGFYIGGTLAFKPEKEEAFTFSVSAAYAKGAWLFEGGLSGGNVTLAALLSGILRLDTPAAFQKIALTELWMKYRYSKSAAVNPFSLRAAIDADLSELTPGFSLRAAASLALETDEKGHTTASLLAELAISSFSVTMQLDGLGTENPSYIFTFLFRGKGLRAAYYTDGRKKFLSMNLVNLSLGDVVDFFVGVVDPNYKSTLPAPLDVLYKLNLSRFKLTYGITDGTLELRYTLNLNLLVAKLTSVGVKYIPAGRGKPADVLMTLEGSFGLNGELTSWSLLRDPPPSFGGKGAAGFKLLYLGIVVHFDNAGDDSLLKADSISAALERMEGKPLHVNNPAINFAFGAHFILNGVLDFKLALVDPHIYGFYITVSKNDGPLAAFSGLVLELLYKRISDDLGMFRASLVMPEKFRTFQLGALSVTLGQIVLEIYTDGGFFLDLGFPQDHDFSRSFMLQFGQFTGRAGIYFGILSGAAVPALPDWRGGSFATAIRAGIGVTFGIGRSFDLGIAKGGFELSVVGIFEGTLAFWKRDGEPDPSDLYYKLTATLGIIGRLYVSVDLVIISLSASVEISAFAGAVFETEKPVLLDLDFRLALTGSIKILFIRIKFRFNFHYHAHFEIGGADTLRRVRAPADIRRIDLAGKTKVDWFLSPAGTMNGRTAFVPMLADFSALHRLAVALCLFEQPESLKRSDAALLDADYVNSMLTLSSLFPFLENNAVFAITAPPTQPDGDAEVDGYAFPMPPPVTLTIDGDAAQALDYASYRPVTDTYLAKIDDYFANLPVDGNPAATSTRTPVSSVMFLDYFRMLARQIYGELRAIFDSYSVPLDGGDFAGIAGKYGVSAGELAAGNSGLLFQSNARVVVDIDYICPVATSFRALAERFSVQDLWEQLSGLTILADTEITVSGFTIALEAAKKTAAAFIYARWYGESVDTMWQKLYDEILAASNKNADWECAAQEQGAFSYAGVTWKFQPGDTAERLARQFALLAAEPGFFPAFDAFLAKVTSANGVYRFPDAVVAVSSSETPSQLERRVFAASSGNRVMEYDIIARFANLPIRGAVLAAAHTLADFTAAHGLNYATIAPYLKAEHFAAGQALAVKPGKISLAEIKEFLLGEDVTGRTAAFASRVLLQGLRLPAEAGADTIAFYELCGLQFPLESGSHTVRLDAHPQSFATGSQTYQLDVAAPGTDDYTAVRNKLPDGIVIEDIAPFQSVPATYQASEKFLFGSGAVVRYLPSVPASEPFELYSPGGDKIACEPALCLPFTVTRESDAVLRVVGLAPADRGKLRPLSEWPACTYRVLYKPSALTGLSGTLLDAGFGENERFIKTNLSRETKLAADRLHGSSEYVCNLSDPAFVRLLWECSVTAGRYALYLSDAARLPADIFDDGNETELYLLITGGDNLAEAANCVISAAAAYTDDDAYFLRRGETASKPALPNGSYGIRIRYTPEDGSVSQILGYTVTVGGRESNLSKPLIPLGDRESEDTAVYEPVFSVVSDPYEDFGLAAVKVYLRDIFGNQSAAPVSHTVEFRVNDFIASVNDWYGVTCSYAFSGGGMIVTLRAQEASKRFSIMKQALEQIKRALMQQRQGGASLSLVSTLLAEEFQVTPNPLPVFLEEMLLYYGGSTTSTREVPALSISVSVHPDELPADPIFPVEVAVRIRRNVKAAGAPPEVTGADTPAAY
ncbi:MAG TPA: hypothetical protein DEB31_10115, partial [Clostridiales bacterium]|nr:hypothetical protein [Clostridiales bacterium]